MGHNADIITAEEKLNTLLPVSRLQQSLPALINAAHAWSDTVWAAAKKRGPISLSKQQIIAGLSLASRPIFICGVHRSGTTLVRDILDDHPQLVVLPSEGTFYTNLEAKLKAIPENKRMAYLGKEWLRRLANPINQSPYWLLERSDDQNSAYVDFARYVMAWWEVADKTNPQWPHHAIILAYASCQNKLDAKAWVDKTPVNERYLKRIWIENPQALIIQLIRNPVNILASRKKMEPSITLRNALNDIKLSFSVANQQEKNNDQRFLLIRYENICNNTQQVIEQLAAFLNITIVPQLFTPTVAGKLAQVNSSFTTDNPFGRILNLKQHGVLLTKTDQQYLGVRLGNLAPHLGYTVMRINPLFNYPLRLLYLLKS
ncbi:MAG: sulfotransferase [Mucilaginibacter sp.]